MEKFRYTKEGEDKCRQGIGWKKSCWRCSYEMLCLFQQNQDKICGDILKIDNSISKDLGKDM